MARREDKNLKIDGEIQRTLESLDALQSIDARPFFMTRLRQAVEARTRVHDNWLCRMTLGYKLVPLGLMLFVLLNVATLIFGTSSNAPPRGTDAFPLGDAAHEYYSLSVNAWVDEPMQNEK